MNPEFVILNSPFDRCLRTLAVSVLLAVMLLSPGINAGAPGGRAGSAHADQPASAPPRSWSPEVMDALRSYQAGDYATAQRWCAQVVPRRGQERAQLDAAVIEALCLLRMPARSDRVDGRVRLKQLYEEDPTLADEPECDLAWGIAQTALAETGDALGSLARAADGFAAQGLPDRQTEALVALAEAWARHGEWETTPARFGIRRPTDSATANAIRRAQIEAVRSQIETLPDPDEALARVNLILAEHLLESDGETDEALAILSRLAQAPELTLAGADAAMRLAEHHESVGQWDQALRLYERLRREWHGDLVRVAEQRALEITRPKVVLEVPAAARTGQKVNVRVRVRGLDHVQLEVRHADVEAWLASSQTRASEAFLPESGSLRAAWELDTRAPGAHGWWESDGVDPPLEFSAEPGPYVVLARGQGGDGRTQVVKRLVTIGNLVATCFVGPREALVWAVCLAPSADNPGPGATAKFWMNRSFMATERKLERGLARFPLPGEARVMRDKGWVCLVRSGEQLTVCRGQLPQAEASEGPARAALVAGPPAPQVGELLYVSGLLLPAGGRDELPAADATVQIRVVDAVEKVLWVGDAKVSAGGTFASEVPIAADWAGKHLRVLARYRGAVLENILGRVTLSVPDVDQSRFRVRVELPPWYHPSVPLVTGGVQAEYPWGTVPTRADVRCTFRAVQLATTLANNDPVLGKRLDRHGQLDQRGWVGFAVPPDDFGLSDGPLAIGVEATVTSWDGRRGVGTAETLLGPQPVHAWLKHDPPEPVAGCAVRFHLGWFQAGGLSVTRLPDVEIRCNGTEVAHLPTYSTREGLVSDPWRPAEPGSYQVVATLTTMEAEPLLLSKVLEVSAPEPNAAIASRPQCRAYRALEGGRNAVRIELDGELPVPLAVLVVAGDPLAAATVDKLAGPVELLLPLDQGVPDLRVLVLTAGPDGPELLCVEDVAADPHQALRLRLAAPDTDPWPQTTVVVRATCHPAVGTALTARLIHAATAGYSDQPASARRPPATSAAQRITMVSSTGRPVASAEAEPGEADLSIGGSDTTALQRALLEGATLWTTSVASQAELTELAVPLPAEPGLYKLIVLARASGGAIATEAVILDARRGVRLALDTPEQLTLGDRSLLALRAENGYTEPIKARIEWQPGEGLHAESLRVAAQGQPTLLHPAGEPVILELPANGHAWLQAEIEAIRVGPGQARAEVLAGQSRQTAVCPYEIVPPAVAPADTHIKIKRVLFVWKESDGQDDPAVEKRWEWVARSADERLAPGQFVRVREYLMLCESEAEMTWSQRVPATCRVMSPQPSEESIGRPQGDQLDRLVFQVPGLPAGVHVHEYTLAVVRPGACLLPAPELRRGATRLPVLLDPPELRLVVANAG